MNNLKIFENPYFGKVRTIQEADTVLFCGKDVAKALGYADQTNAIKQHCHGVVKRHLTDSMNRNQEINFIPEGDVYRLIIRSKLPAAEKFERWVFDEVLPAIRKTGKYIAPQLKEQISLLKQMQINVKEVEGYLTDFEAKTSASRKQYDYWRGRRDKFRGIKKTYDEQIAFLIDRIDPLFLE